MTFRLKEPCGTTSIVGSVLESGIGFMIRSEKRSVSLLGGNRRPVPEAWIHRASRRLELRRSGDSTWAVFVEIRKINGIKRHIWVDTLGLLLIVVVHTAAIQDRDGGKLVLSRIKNRFPRLRLLWADDGPLRLRLLSKCTKLICPRRSNRKRPPLQDGRELRRYKRRWKIERTILWLQDFRRLVVRYDHKITMFDAYVQLASAMIALRRL